MGLMLRHCEDGEVLVKVLVVEEGHLLKETTV
jgi:hypothetical protein